MTRVIVVCIGIVTLISSCSEPNKPQKEETFQPTCIKELIDLNEIDSVEMINHSGKHIIAKENLDSFRQKLGESCTVMMTCKMGAIAFNLFIDGKKIPFFGSTHGEYIESLTDCFPQLEHEDDYIYFKVSDFNLDNY